MSLFKPAENTMAYFKAGFMGEAGSGKTHTATLTSVGLVQHLRNTKIAGSEKPVYFLDKDRSQRLDGEQFPNPTFQTFLPHIEFLTLGGRHEGVDTSRTSDDIIPDDDTPMGDRKHIRREIVVEELDALLAEHGLAGTAGEAKQKRAALIKKHFGATSRTEIEKLMPLYDLQRAFNDLHVELTGKPSRYDTEIKYKAPTSPAEICKAVAAIDEIPNFDKPKSEAAE